ncbi:type II secretion system F family protein [Candidatus Pacearchaeota archaeon]|nr:type II secretion system F family protein [Candidatus Pacearchaeota archaeon]
MNTLKFYPRRFRDDYAKNIKNAGISTSPEDYHNKIFFICTIFATLSLSILIITKKSFLLFLLVFAILYTFFYFKISLKANERIKKMESLFPDVISLMASNLRSGITIDRAFLLSARPEFDPLDKEILKTGKEITTGQDIIFAFKKMAERIDSEKISKVIMLIISGLKAGGNISDLLEQTSSNMKEKEIIEKKSRSTILMYVIFIFFAVGVGAPVLFALSSVLVEIVLGLSANLPETTTAATSSLPLAFSRVSISLNFVIYFSLIFIAVTDFISCFVIGLVNKGEAKEGIKFFIPLLAISYTLFFIIKGVISGLLLESISFI